MKKLIVIFALAVLTAQSVSAQSMRLPPLSMSWGGRIGLVVPQYLDAAFGFGGQFDVGCEIGPFGYIHYMPNLDMWTRHYYYDYRPYYPYVGDNVRRTEISFNIFDGRYFPPLPQSFIAQPYAGLGPMFAIRVDSRPTVNPSGQEVGRDRHSYFDAGFNFFGGCEFRLTSAFTLFAEMRGQLGDYDAFKLSAGAEFTIK
jgi:hypothetical protein